MRELHPYVWEPLERTGVNHLNDGPRGVERKLVEPHRPGERLRVGRQSRMDEHVGAPPVEFGEHGIPSRIAEVDAVDVAHQQNPI